MDNEKNMIPYIVYESMLDKEDRHLQRQARIIILLIVLLVASNVIWIIAWNQYDYVDAEEYTVELDSEGEGNANYIGEDGTIYNGTSDSTQAQDAQ